jgi:hypothetical protein
MRDEGSRRFVFYLSPESRQTGIDLGFVVGGTTTRRIRHSRVQDDMLRIRRRAGLRAQCILRSMGQSWSSVTIFSPGATISTGPGRSKLLWTTFRYAFVSGTVEVYYHVSVNRVLMGRFSSVASIASLDWGSSTSIDRTCVWWKLHGL